jgi:hypothetical protein
LVGKYNPNRAVNHPDFEQNDKEKQCKKKGVPVALKGVQKSRKAD